MELRQYGNVLWRRWPLVVGIVALTALFSLLSLLVQHPGYTASTKIAIRQRLLPPTVASPQAGTPSGSYASEKYYNFYSSEFLADDYAIIVTSGAFARLVDAKLAAAGRPVEAAGTMSTDRKQRELTIAATAGDAATAIAIAKAAGDVFTDLSAPGAPSPSANGIAIHDDAQFAVIDPPGGAFSSRNRQFVNAAIATAVGLVLAVALAFLLEALDMGLRDAADAAQATGLPVLGTIPRTR